MKYLVAVDNCFLDAPGGMKIQTIHAFCQSVLKRFPLEAGIAPHFQVLDERTAGELFVDAREEVLARARGDGGELGAALGQVTRHVTEAEFVELMRDLAAKRSNQADANRCFCRIRSGFQRGCAAPSVNAVSRSPRYMRCSNAMASMCTITRSIGSRANTATSGELSARNIRLTRYPAVCQ